MILGLRTDTAFAELYLIDSAVGEICQDKWEAGHELSMQLLERIEKFLDKQKITWDDLSGIVVYQGPGSFTGLRIGLTVANTIAYSQNIPIAGGEGEEWLKKSLARLKNTPAGGQVLPIYGSEANITKPRK